jgi:hypothetical protein
MTHYDFAVMALARTLNLTQKEVDNVLVTMRPKLPPEVLEMIDVEIPQDYILTLTEMVDSNKEAVIAMFISGEIDLDILKSVFAIQ